MHVYKLIEKIVEKISAFLIDKYIINVKYTHFIINIQMKLLICLLHIDKIKNKNAVKIVRRLTYRLYQQILCPVMSSAFEFQDFNVREDVIKILIKICSSYLAYQDKKL